MLLATSDRSSASWRLRSAGARAKPTGRNVSCLPFPVEFFDMGRPLFVHLRMHSEYSVTDGIVRIDDAVQRAAQDQMPALALTDAGNLFGMVKFYGAARQAGVKPIIGADCWIEN